MEQVRLLWFHSRVPQRLFEAACRLPALRGLYIKWSGIKCINALPNFAALEHLHIGSSTQIESIKPIAALQSLQTLELENIRSMRDLTPLASLKGLEGLSIGGGMWARQEFTTLAPLAALRSLRWLFIENAGVLDQSTEPLEQLTQLEDLCLPLNAFPLTEYARLAARLPRIAPCMEPPFVEFNHADCAACGKRKLVLPLGRGRKQICKHCQSKRFTAHLEEFRASVASFGDNG